MVKHLLVSEFRTFVVSFIIPDTSNDFVPWRWETDPGITVTKVRCGPRALPAQSLDLINYTFSSLVCLYSPSTSTSFHLSTCLLDDIVLCLWEWLWAIPKGVNDSQLYLLLTDIFTSRSSHHVFVWTQSNTHGWKHCMGQTDLQATKDLHMWWGLHYRGNALCLTKHKSLCRAKEQQVWTRMLFKCSIHCPFQ